MPIAFAELLENGPHIFVSCHTRRLWEARKKWEVSRQWSFQMKRRVSHSTQRKIFVYIVPIAVVVVTRKLCANKKTPNNACDWNHPDSRSLPNAEVGRLFCFLKQQLPEQKALCSRQFWGPPIAQGCSHIWCCTITNKNNNTESCTHFAQYGVLKVTQ